MTEYFSLNRCLYGYIMKVSDFSNLIIFFIIFFLKNNLKDLVEIRLSNASTLGYNLTIFDNPWKTPTSSFHFMGKYFFLIISFFTDIKALFRHSSFAHLCWSLDHWMWIKVNLVQANQRVLKKVPTNKMTTNGKKFDHSVYDHLHYTLHYIA